MRLEVEKEVNQVELKRCQDQIKQLELQMQFCTRFLKAKDDVNALESKVKSVSTRHELGVSFFAVLNKLE